MMKNICLMCTAFLLAGMVACNQRPGKPAESFVDETKRTDDIVDSKQNLTFTTTKINETEVLHELTMKVDTNTYYHMVAIIDLQTGKPSKRIPNFNEMEK